MNTLRRRRIYQPLNLLAVPFLLFCMAGAANAQTVEVGPQLTQTDFVAQVKEAQRLLDDEKYQEATAVIDKMIAAQPQNYALYVMRASAYLGRYYQIDAEVEELTLLKGARAAIVKSRELANGDKDLVEASNALMEVVESELKDFESDSAPPEAILPPIPKKSVAVAPKPAPQAVPQPKPAVPAPAAPATAAPTGQVVLPSGMVSNIPLNLPGPATPPVTNDPLILAKETKNRKYPTHDAYNALATGYVQLGMYAEAARNYRTNAQLYRRSPAGEQSALINESLASRYENEVRLFVDRPLTEGEKSALDTRAPLEPAVGTYLGAFIDRDDRLKTVWTSEYFQSHRDPQEFAKLVGKEHASVFMYASYGVQFPGEWLQRCKERGVIPQIAWEPQGGLNEVQEDEYLVEFAKQCGKLNWPIFLRFASEMNGGWTKWSGNPALYREKFALVNRVFKKYAPRVATIWCVNGVPLAGVMDYYPGDANCDWVGINLYSVPFYSEKSMEKPGDLDSPTNVIQPIYDMFKDRKPIALCEYASSQMHIAEKKPRIDFAVNKMSLLYGSLPRLFPRIKMVDWFDQNNIQHAPLLARRINNFSLTENGIVLSAYQGLIQSPYFIAGGTGLNANVEQNSGSPVPCAIVPGQSVKGVARFSVWVKTPVQRPLVYLQIGNKLVYAAKRPGAHVIDVDTSQIPRGRQLVTVYVYSDAGKFVDKQTTSMTFGPTRGDDTAPLYVSGTIKDYYVDRSGYVTALALQTMGSVAYVHFAPDMAAQLLDRFPVNGQFSAWLKLDAESGPGHWQLLSLENEKPAAGMRRVLPSDLARLGQEATVDREAPDIKFTGKLSGVVAGEDDKILAVVMDGNTLVRIPAALRELANGNPLALSRNVEVNVSARVENPLEGAVSSFGDRLVATDLEIGGLRASEVGLPLVTVKQVKEISGEAAVAPVKVRGGAKFDLKSQGYSVYLPAMPLESGTGTTRGGGALSIYPATGRPW